MDPVPALTAAIRAGLAAAADPARAPGQQAYMKTDEPFLGVRVPQVRRIVAEALRTWTLDRGSWDRAVRDLFDGATHREHRYAALALLRHRSARPYRDQRCLDLVRHLVVAGAWWDLVDDVAHALTDALVADAPVVGAVVREWAHEEDIWLRRVAVLSQLRLRSDTDRALLAECLDAQLGRPEFWLRKACGWALRDLSHADPAWVTAYLGTRADRVSPLTRREALRAIERRPNVAASGR